MDGPPEYYAKQNKQVRERQCHMISYVTHTHRQQHGDSQRERVWGIKGSGQRGVSGDRMKLCLGSWVHDAVCRLYFIELYT